MGFLVVGLRSCKDWVREERARWKGKGKRYPLTLEELELELDREKVERG